MFQNNLLNGAHNVNDDEFLLSNNLEDLSNSDDIPLQLSLSSSENNQIKKDAAFNGKQYKCSNCPFQTVFKMELAKHCKKHYTKKKFVCSECPFSSQHKTVLMEHMAHHRTNSAVTIKTSVAQQDAKKRNSNVHNVLTRQIINPTLLLMKGMFYLFIKLLVYIYISF